MKIISFISGTNHLDFSLMYRKDKQKGSYELPSSTLDKLHKKLYKKSKLRKLATVVKNHSLKVEYTSMRVVTTLNG